MLPDWIQRTWFRHPLSLRPDYMLRFADGSTNRAWQGEVGLPRFYYGFDPHFHARSRKFLGFIWNIGPFEMWIGLKDSN